jgi:hypothetical protein
MTLKLALNTTQGTHIWNGLNAPSREKSNKHQGLTKWLPFQQSVAGVCLNLREATAMWRFNGRSDGKMEVAVL